MLKFTGRFLIVLAVSILLALGIYWVVQKNPSALGLSNFPGRFEGRRFSESNAQGITPGTNPSQNGIQPAFQGRGFEDREHDFDGRANPGFGLFGILRNLGVIGLITLVVVGLQKLLAGVIHKRPARMVSLGG